MRHASIQPTYEELKLRVTLKQQMACRSIQPTYEELKQVS